MFNSYQMEHPVIQSPAASPFPGGGEQMGRRCSVILLGGTVSPEMGLRFPERVAPPHLGFTFLPLSQERFPMLRLPLQVGDGSHPLPTPGHAPVWPDPAASACEILRSRSARGASRGRLQGIGFPPGWCQRAKAACIRRDPLQAKAQPTERR